MIAREMMMDGSTLQCIDLVVSAKRTMHELCLNQMVVLQGNDYCGIVSIEELQRVADDTLLLRDLQKAFSQPMVTEEAHIFDVMKTALHHQSKIVAVVDTEKNFKGLISAENCLRWFGMLSSVQDAGGVLELQMPAKEYSLTEISRVAENNDTQILCCFTSIDPVTDKVNVTLRFNQSELSGLVQAYERHGYTIMGLFNEEGYTEELKDRYDALMRYLNV